MKNILKHTGLLAAITIIAGLCLGLVHEITLQPIAKAKEDQKNAAYTTVFADADDFTAVDFDQKEADKVAAQFGKCVIDEVVEAKKGGETLGYIITVTDSEGYGGDIQFTVGVNAEGSVTGVSFLSIAESPGLGMNARDDASLPSSIQAKLSRPLRSSRQALRATHRSKRSRVRRSPPRRLQEASTRLWRILTRS